MPRIVGWVGAVALVVIVAAWFWTQREKPRLTLGPAPRVETPAPPVVQGEPQVQFPLPQPATPQQLPPLDKSDARLRDSLAGLGAQPTWLEKLVFEDFVRRVVATVDRLPTQKIALRLLPVRSVPGKFLTVSDADGIRLDPQNGKRYAPYLQALAAIDAKRLAAFYVEHYALFQQAYEELGYPKGYFNDRLIAVIDHLLATPAVAEPVRLVQPEVMYQFADPQMEARSAGQKILMRMGNANAATVKDKLREIRRELAGSPPSAPG